MGLFTCAVVGSTFGAAFDLSLMNDPWVIQTQFGFTSFLMLRMFVAAVASSIASIQILERISKHKQPSCYAPLSLDQTKRGLLGGGLLGAGMALSGSCPGTVWAQIGTNLANILTSTTISTFFGAIFGCFTFALLQDRNKLPNFTCPVPNSSSKSGKSDNLAKILMLTGCCVGLISAVEVFFPWRSQLSQFLVNVPNKDSFKVVDPLFAGIAIGVSQIVSYSGNSMGLGSSSGWMFLTSKLFPFSESKTLKDARKSIVGKNQLFTALFIVVGSFCSQYWIQNPEILRHSTFAQVTQKDLIKSFVGGFLALFGSRIAGGCTSGHGLTGVANLNPMSFVTVVAMFGGGIAVTLFSS